MNRLGVLKANVELLKKSNALGAKRQAEVVLDEIILILQLFEYRLDDMAGSENDRGN